MNGNPLFQQNPGSAVPSPGQISKHKSPLDNSARELAQAINQAHEVLAKSTTVFPFTVFPDTVTLDREKLTITHRIFFRTGEVMSIHIKDILNVTADVGPFFGSIKVFTRFFNVDKPYTVNYLPRKDALKLKRILQGLVIAGQKNIDTSHLTPAELCQMLEELGS